MNSPKTSCIRVKMRLMMKQFSDSFKKRDPQQPQMWSGRCGLNFPPSDPSNSLIGNWPSHWDQSVCWSSGIFINSLCFSVALISWRRGVRGVNGWLDGRIIYLSGVKGHSMPVRAGTGWYSQRLRELRLYIPDLLNVWLFMFDLVNSMHRVGGFSAQNARFQCWASGKTQHGSPLAFESVFADESKRKFL